MSGKKPPPSPGSPSNLQDSDGGTRVDLGEDLLAPEAPTVISPSLRARKAGAGAVAAETPDDLVANARILFNEGILEEAKRRLRQALVRAESHHGARTLLKEIHEAELKQIFAEADAGPRRRFGRESESLEAFKADLVMESLDRDLGLGLGLSLFDAGPAGVAALEQFGEKMDRELADEGAGQRSDLGIAFLEMGLPELAIRHFRAAAQRTELSEAPEAGGQAEFVAAHCLLALAEIAAGRPFEAAQTLQPIVSDAIIVREGKLEPLYLMGRALEAQRQPREAARWYEQAAELDPHYRDLADRLRELRRAAARGEV